MNHRYGLLFGICLWSAQAVSAADPMELRAGPLSMVFDTDHAMLRFIRVGQVEVLRGINAPVRDQFWATLPTEVTNVQLRAGRDRFSLTFDVSCRQRDIDFSWNGKIEGTAEGTLRFDFDGVANTGFLKNRIGFCILHPSTAADLPWKIEATDGTRVAGKFPRFIAPHQPAMNLRAIEHEFAPGAWAEVRLAGETFEMEDQRNWTDGSFKTYCTPLGRPYPVRIAAGTKIEQSVGLRLTGQVGALAAVAETDSGEVTLTLAEGADAVRPLPGIGLQTSSQVVGLNDLEIKRLKQLSLDHLRISLAPANDDLTGRLRAASQQARALGVPLHIALRLSPEPAGELRQLAASVQATEPPVAAWVVTEATAERFEMVRRILGTEVSIGVGEDTNFTELNRNRPQSDAIQLVSFGLNPQCHARDNLTMIETLQIQGEAVDSARQFIGDRRLLVSPVTLKVQKINQPPLPGELPTDVDSRQPPLFAAGWTLGSIKYLAEAGVDGLTYYETVGWKGVMAPGPQVRLPQIFPAQPSRVYAVYHILCAVGEFAGGQVRRVDSSAAMEVVAMALRQRDRSRLLVANLSQRRKTVRLRGVSAGSARLFRLNRGNVASSAIDPDAFSRRPAEVIEIGPATELALAPHEIVRIDR